MIDLLVSLIILLIVGGLVWYLVTLLPLPAPVKQVINICAILILILLILGVFFGGVDMPHVHFRN